MTWRDRPPVLEVALVAVGLLLAAWCGVVYTGAGFWIQRIVLICQISGYAALGFLALSLLLGPLLRGLTWVGVQVDPRVSFPLSRNAGIAAGLAALVHTGIVLTTYLHGSWWAALGHPYLQSGVLALVIFVVLLVGSLKPLMARLGWRLWKPMFRLSFAAAALTFHHLLYAPFASKTWTVGLFAGLLLVSLLRFLPPRVTRRVAAPGFPATADRPRNEV